MDHRTTRLTAPTQRLPERRPRTGFYAAVGCLSVIAGLLLGVGGFFGVRALQDDGGAPVAGEHESPASAGESEPAERSWSGGEAEGADGEPAEQSTEDAALPTGEPLADIPVGREQAVPFGASFPLQPAKVEAEVEVAVTAVDWDATQEILDANSFTEEPGEGRRYVMFTIEGVHRGETPFDGGYAAWIQCAYAGPEDTLHRQVYVVTPRHDEDIEQVGADPGEEFVSELVIELSDDVPRGGHLVLFDAGQELEEGAWIEMP